MQKKNLLPALLLWGAQALAQVGVESPSAPVAPPEATWVELLQAKDYPRLEDRMATTLEAARSDLAQYRVARRALAALVVSKPQTGDRFDEWVAATHSGTARLARGEFLLQRAWLARGSDSYRNTHPDAIARMKVLLPAARNDFEVALEKLGPRCDFCYAGLLDVALAEGERARAVALVDRAIQALDGGIATPRSYLAWLEPRWGGHAGEAQRFVDGFAADGPQRPAIPLLRSALLVERSRELAARRQPEQALLLAQQATELDPGNSAAWERVAADALDLKHHALVLEATRRALEIQPASLYALNARASALLRGPAPLEAVPFLERAVERGDEWALKALLPIVAGGQHGFRPDRERAERICQSAIDALLPAGFACMGGLEYFGIGRPANRQRARQWFLEAADRGVPVAMVDAAKMLLAGDGGPRDEARAVALLRQAHRAGEPRAEAMLRSELSTAAYWRYVAWPEKKAQVSQALQDHRAQTRLMIFVACLLLGALSWGFMYRAGDRPAHRIGPRRHLRAGRALRLLVLGNVALALAGFWLVRHAAPEQRLWGWTALAVILAGALYLVYRVFLTRTWFDEDAVHFTSPLRGTRTIRFDRIADLGWSWLAQCDYIASADGERIHVSQMLEGYGELYERIELALGTGGTTEPATEPAA